MATREMLEGYELLSLSPACLTQSYSDSHIYREKHIHEGSDTHVKRQRENHMDTSLFFALEATRIQAHDSGRDRERETDRDRNRKRKPR
jgi:hypothetical protein